MKSQTYTATEFRNKHSEALNFAEAGLPVFIKRGVKVFRITLYEPTPPLSEIRTYMDRTDAK
jgi:hypothetical protein